MKLNNRSYIGKSCSFSFLTTDSNLNEIHASLRPKSHISFNIWDHVKIVRQFAIAVLSLGSLYFRLLIFKSSKVRPCERKGKKGGHFQPPREDRFICSNVKGGKQREKLKRETPYSTNLLLGTASLHKPFPLRNFLSSIYKPLRVCKYLKENLGRSKFDLQQNY